MQFLPPTRALCRSLIAAAGLIALMITSGCGTPNSPMSQPQAAPTVAEVNANVVAGGSTPKVLLYVGNGTTSGSVAAVKTILSDLSLKYATADTSQLNNMTQSKLSAYKLLLIPGGNAVTISKSLSSKTVATIHSAIANDGLHYLGICAGGFFAGHSGVYDYLDLSPVGIWFNFYADYFKGIHKEAVEVRSPDGTKRDQYWQDGPQFSGWGNVVAKYPDGTPAVVENKVGNGFVILCAVHPEATQAWRGSMKFTTSVAVDNAYAKTLVTNALNGTSMPHF
jgi:glutamine amidotransferase PdxT